jgi:hypothetical protein
MHGKRDKDRYDKCTARATPPHGKLNPFRAAVPR